MLLLLGNNLSAQGTCDNIDNRQGTNTGNNYITGGQSFGQTFQADASCLGGTAFSEISIRGNGNSPSRWDLSIYEGQILPTTDSDQCTVKPKFPFLLVILAQTIRLNSKAEQEA